MTAVYVDTSALGRVLLGERGAPACERALRSFGRHVSSRLLRVELRRVALRFQLLERADELVAGFVLLPIDEDLLVEAEALMPASVATLDAIHLVTATRLAAAGSVEAIITYDEVLADGARHHGLTVIGPA